MINFEEGIIPIPISFPFVPYTDAEPDFRATLDFPEARRFNSPSD
jgi:hypothetical protein